MKRISMLFVLLTVLAALAGAVHAEEERFVDKAGRTVKKGAEAAGKGIEKGVDAAGRGVSKGAEATGRVFKKAGDWIGNKLGGASEPGKSKEQ
jgi:hypothetical protein